MNKNQFRKILKRAIEEKALQYLLGKRRNKGKEIKYSCLRMAEYLLPQKDIITISEKQYIFSIRNRMVQIENNFPEKKIEKLCRCGLKEDMKHIYYCKILNSEEPKTEYEEIFKNDIRNQILVLRRFSENMENSLSHGILKIVDPLYYSSSAAMEIN